MPRPEKELSDRLHELADLLGITLAELLEMASLCGLEIVAIQGRPIKHPGHA